MTPDFQNANYAGSFANESELPPMQAEIAFVGRSNVGKSAMINALCHPKKLARISQTPGCTRTINVYTLGQAAMVDLPGYGFARGPADERAGWKMMIEGYLTQREALRCTFMIVDAKVGPTPLDIQMALYLQSQALPYRIVANKADQVKASKTVLQKKTISQALQTSESEVFWVSAAKGSGIRPLRAFIAEVLEQP